MADNAPKLWQVALILVSAGIVSRKMLRPDKFVKLLIGAARLAWLLRDGEAWIIGDVEQQYGSFRLHGFSLQRKDGTTRRNPYVMVIVGAIAAPVVVSLGQTSNLLQTFEDRHGAVYLGNIRRSHSEPCDVYRYVRQWQGTEDEAWVQRQKPFAPRGLNHLPLETRERIRRQTEAKVGEEKVRAEARARVVAEALREFELRWQCETR